MAFSTRALIAGIVCPAAAGLAVGLLTTPLFARGDGVVRQSKTSFMPRAVTIARGDSVAITNEDPFLHHIYVDSPSFKFDSGEQKPGQTVTLRFPVAGRFVAQCAIHLKMQLTVDVR